MGQKEKLILLDYLEFTKSNKGKTSGSRVMFTSEEHGSILLHKPHPQKELKAYQVRQLCDLLEQEGLIYPVKGTGNFIADSEEVRKLSKASYIKELKTLIRKGKAMGMEAEELIYIIRECYKEEKP